MNVKRHDAGVSLASSALDGAQSSSRSGSSLGHAALSCGERRVQSNRFRWLGAKWTVGMAVLTLAAVLQAQSSECSLALGKQRSETAESRGGDGEADWLYAPTRWSHSVALQLAPVSDAGTPGEGSKPHSAGVARNSAPIDTDRNFFYRNKFEFSLEGGWLPINIPFVFDVFLGDGYTTTSLKYTLAPIIASVRWQVDDVGGPWIFRGNWDVEASGAAVVIPRGPETRYFAFILGFRRNFVPRRGRFAPYFDGRLGMGDINAKEPLGVLYAQGQNFTFTMNMGSGIRYNFSPRYAIWTGLNWMHISNLYLSQPQFANYGINVYGPMLGIDVRLGNFHHRSAE